jgi:hypothetical protein
MKILALVVVTGLLAGCGGSDSPAASQSTTQTAGNEAARAFADKVVPGYPLTGVKKVSVSIVIPDDPEIRRDVFEANLLLANIQRDVEIKLRKTGIEVCPPGPGVPHFIAEFSGFRNDRSVTLGLAVTLTGMAIVLHRPATPTLVNCVYWHRMVVVDYGSARFGELRNLVADQTDEFINDWLKANPAN